METTLRNRMKDEFFPDYFLPQILKKRLIEVLMLILPLISADEKPSFTL